MKRLQAPAPFRYGIPKLDDCVLDSCLSITKFLGFKKLIANKGYEGEIAVSIDSDDTNNLRCYEDCQKCSNSTCNEVDIKEPVWKVVKGKFFMVSGANISCACARSPNGIAPYSHIGDGNVHMILVHHTNVINNLRLLLRLSGKKESTVEDLSFVEVVKGKEFCFRSGDSKSKWNCDGEVQIQTDIRARVCCQLLKVYSRGNPKPEAEKESCCSFTRL